MARAVGLVVLCGCRIGFDPAGVTDTTYDTSNPDAGPTDFDGDGADNVDDNCPMIANPDQGNEDGDAVGDLCDSCPFDATTASVDGDGDGLDDVCDPRPATPGDSIAWFEGFHAGIPATWQVVGDVSQMGDHAVIAAPAGSYAALVAPMDAPTNGTLFASVDIVTTVGNADAIVSLAMPYDAQRDRGIFCELYAPMVATTMNRELSIFDSIAGTVRGRTSYAWQVGTTYTFAYTRTGSDFDCVLSAAAGGDQVTGTSTSMPANPQVGITTYSLTATIAWMMLVTSS